MSDPKTSYNIIEDEVIKLWTKSGYSYDVVAFFYQKYEWEKEWNFCSEIIISDSSCTCEMTFLKDFCEGETCVKDLKIVPLRDILEYYAERQVNDTSTSG